MTPEQLRDDLTDTRIDSDWHSAGYCPHDTPLYLHCDACAVKRVTAQYRAPFTADEIRRADRALSKYQRHTVDITGPAPQYVEDEMLAMERGWKRAKVAWVALGVLVVGYVVWRVVGGGE